MKELKNKKIVFLFYLFVTIVPIFCLLLDYFMSSIQPVEMNVGEYSIDKSLINQLIYWSVWSSIDICIFGLLNAINNKHNNMPNWITGKNNFTRITAESFILFVIWIGGLAGGAVVGFNSWYKITKSILEHVLVPIIIIIFYFLINNERFSTKIYFKKYSWFSLIVVSLYSLFVISRAIMIQFYDNNDEPFSQFPYDQMNPSIVGWPLVIIFFILFLSSFVAISTLFNWLSNINLKYRSKKNNIA
ncbi:hypothetical protein [Spiroplasma turonicum]|uniref:Transmembrane protein n=1 Tax=Spiroplasma turonicum TaxID=216946 RepID=A0A0K1P6W2_9MOLU|nr:hypothetical protein [Spiroplasma turonicum]AKU80010.1 hypothetical protein STURON_00764 [Spiroplasma turonicum]ALX71012.1 hypothetical protein STURO_v1c07610 [Spiroplasma turonicum]